MTIDIAERIAFVGLGRDELRLLGSLAPILEEHAAECWPALRDALRELPTMCRQFAQPGVEQHLEGQMRDHLVALAAQEFDDEFVETRARIGRRMQRAGVEPHWLVRIYALHLAQIVPYLSRSLGDGEELSRVLRALGKRVALEAEITIGAYIEHKHAHFERVAACLAERERRLEEDLRTRGAELRQAAERARAAEQMASIGVLVAGLAHEVATPMSVIQCHARLLAPRQDDDEAAWRLETICHETARISRILQTLLKLANPRRNPKRPLRIAPLLADTIDFLAEPLRKRGIDVKGVLGSESAEVVADAERLQQLFLNLLMNAADAMPDGGEVRVELCEVEAEGQVCVRVSDAGVGIAPAHLERIFEPFFTTKEAGQGNGLGLMVCKEIAADHGGTIAVRSAPGDGAEFSVMLPSRSAAWPDDPDVAGIPG